MCAECRTKYITNDNLESATRRKSKCGNGSQLEKSKSLGTNVNGVQYHLVLYSESFHKYILFFGMMIQRRFYYVKETTGYCE